MLEIMDNNNSNNIIFNFEIFDINFLLKLKELDFLSRYEISLFFIFVK